MNAKSTSIKGGKPSLRHVTYLIVRRKPLLTAHTEHFLYLIARRKPLLMAHMEHFLEGTAEVQVLVAHLFVSSNFDWVKR